MLTLPLFVWLMITSTGQKQLLALSTDWVNKHTQYKIDLSEVQGNILYAFEVGDLTIKQSDQLLCSAKNLRVDWDPLALWNKQVHIYDLSADSLTINPQNTPPQPASTPNSIEHIDISSLVYPIHIERIQLPITMASNLFTVQGNINLAKQQGDLTIDRNNVPFATFASMQKSDSIQVHLTVHEPDSAFISTFIKNQDYQFTSNALQADLNILGALHAPTIKGTLEVHSKINNVSQPSLNAVIRSNFISDSNVLNSDLSFYFDDSEAFKTELRYQWKERMGALKGAGDLSVLNYFLDSAIIVGSGHCRFDLTSTMDTNGFSPKGSIQLKDIHVKQTDLGLNLSKGNAFVTVQSLNYIQIDHFKGNLNDGSINLSGKIDGDHISANASVNNLSLSPLLSNQSTLNRHAFGSSALSMTTKLEGKLNQPNVDAKITVSDISLSDNGESTLIDAQAVVTTQNNQYIAEISLDPPHQKMGTIEFKTAQDRLLNSIKDTVDVTMDLNIDVGSVYRLFKQPALEMDGRLSGALTIGGPITSPTLQGDLHLDQGTIKHKVYGLDFQDIGCHAIAKTDHIDIPNCRVFDHEKGQLIIQGNIAIVSPYTLQLQLKTEQLKALNSKQYSGYMAGDLTVFGPGIDPSIKGDITFDKVSITLPDLNLQSHPKIEVISKQSLDEEAENSQANDKVGTADIKIAFPRRVFIQGKGLDAELGGKLHVVGPTTSPNVDGDLTFKRGTYEFLNKKFKIKRGKVNILSNDILLDFIAQTKANGITINVHINGTPDKIKLALSSIPSYPQDEILAKVLFDKKVSSLSPLQAAQLANAIRMLSNGESGTDLGVLSTAKSILKVDELEINGTSLEDTRIGAGKYISENVYVKGEQGASPDSTKVSVDVKLTDNISIESSSGATTQNNDIKIFWQKSY